MISLLCTVAAGRVELSNAFACSLCAAADPFPRTLPAQISGQFKVDGSGNVEFKEEDGIDYAAVTVQLAGGERVPFLFTIKELDAKGNLDGFGGDFLVPSYRGSSFLDPKVRCAPAGRDVSGQL